MTAKRWAAAAVVGTLLGSAGCVTCCHTASKAGFEAGPECDLPLEARRKTYAVLLAGLAPGMDDLRDRLAARGFTKLYAAPVGSVGWLEREMVRLRAEEPSVRFVVVGADLGCPAAYDLARRGQLAGVPVDALVLLDPAGCKDLDAGEARTVVVRSAAAITQEVRADETVHVPSAGRLDLPAHPRTTEAVVRQLTESALRVEFPPADGPPVATYPFPPPVRFLPGEPGDEPVGPAAGPLAPVDRPSRVGPYGLPWPGQGKDAGQPLPTPRPVPGV